MKRKEFDNACKECFYYGVKGKYPEPTCIRSKDSFTGGKLGTYAVFAKICEEIYQGEKIEKCKYYLGGEEERIRKIRSGNENCHGKFRRDKKICSTRVA